MIHVVGAGWYGCYLAHALAKRGVPHRLWEREAVFAGASSANQNRLHLGFHYPRHQPTRVQSRAGFDRFKSEFAELCHPVSPNVYAVSEQSFLDFPTYQAIYAHEGYAFSRVDLSHSVAGIQGAICVDEELVLSERAAAFWSARLPQAELGAAVELHGHALRCRGKPVSVSSDVIVDCTWGALKPQADYHEEYFLIVLLQRKAALPFGALTLMDGPFFSIYPMDSVGERYTLTHVRHGVLDAKRRFDPTHLQQHLQASVADCGQAFSAFNECFEVVGQQVGRKLKHRDRFDDRSCKIRNESNLIQVLSGKIDAVFELDVLVQHLST